MVNAEETSEGLFGFNYSTAPNISRPGKVRYFDAEGGLKQMWLTLNDSTETRNSFLVLYDVGTNKLYLRNDTDTGWLGGYAPGTEHKISNAQGTLDCQYTQLLGDVRSDINIEWSVSLSAQSKGLNQATGKAVDSAGASSSANVGSWEIKIPQPILRVPSPPTDLTSAVNAWKTFSLRYTDLGTSINGHSDPVDTPQGLYLRSAWVQINTEYTWSKGILAKYEIQENKLYLRSEDGQSWIGGYAPGTKKLIATSRGVLDCSKTTATIVENNELEINWYFQAKAPMEGLNFIRSYLIDYEGYPSGPEFTPVGTWRVGQWRTIANRKPGVTVPSPILNPSSKLSETRTAPITYTDADGNADVSWAQIQVDTTSEGANSLIARYDAIKDLLYLRNDAGTQWSRGVRPGAADSLENGQGRLECSKVTVRHSGNSLTIEWSLTPFRKSLGTNTIWGQVADRDNSASPATVVGKWTVTSSTTSTTTTRTPSGNSS